MKIVKMNTIFPIETTSQNNEVQNFYTLNSISRIEHRFDKSSTLQVTIIQCIAYSREKIISIHQPDK